MSEHGVGVLPFDGMGLYEQPRPPRLVFKMPRVVPDQKSKFESDELFRRLSRESEVRETSSCCYAQRLDILIQTLFGSKYKFSNPAHVSI
jgi:hypothetical protein